MFFVFVFIKRERFIFCTVLFSFLRVPISYGVFLISHLLDHNLRQFKTNGFLASLLPVLLHSDTTVEIAFGVMDLLVMALKTDAALRDQVRGR
jgi:hypothetical protein